MQTTARKSEAGPASSTAIPAGRRIPPPMPKQRVERVMASCEGVLDLTAALFNVCGKELRGPGRSSKEVSRVRQIAMYVTHVVLRLSMAEVGVGFGRDRTTVLHACHLIEDLRDEPEFDNIVSMTERVVRAAFGGLDGEHGE